MSQFNISPEEVSKLEEKFEIKSNERKLKNFLKLLTFIALVTMSIYHFYASGFGTIRDILHRGIHISFDNLENIFDLCLSALPFLCLIPAQCECPAIN